MALVGNFHAGVITRCDEARQRLDAFFAVPDRYRGRSSPSDLDSMRKRLERCRKTASG